MYLHAIYSVVIINSVVSTYIPNDISHENFQLVYPKFYSKLRRYKRELSAQVEHEFDLNITVVELSNWVLEYEENNNIHFDDNFTITHIGDKNYTSKKVINCNFLSGKIQHIPSHSAIAICGDELTGFINVGYDLYFIQSVNESSGAHVLFSSDLLQKTREKRSSLGSVCFTTEFNNLEDGELPDDKLIESDDDDESGDNGRAPEEIRYNENWRREQFDSEQMGYFYDSAWETHVFKKRISHKVSAPKRWLEIAIGVDYSVVHFHGKNKVQRYILAVMNIVSAIYQDPSLEANMQLVLTQMILYDQKKYSHIKVGNARKSLENVNIWNRKLHTTLGPDVQRHDIAIYLTRLDIGGPSGYAPVAGACDPSRSCSLNRDEGLTSAFIIAHEMAHVLGLTHDGDAKANNSCVDEATRGSVMASMVSSTFTDFTWSSCSKKEFHKRAANWWCLKNPPSGTTEILKPTLRTTFSMDEQCRMEFGDGYKMCTAFEILEPCSHLWCGHKTSPLVCKTKKGPPLEGTQCGPHKFCVNGYCTPDTYTSQLDPVIHNPQDGGWSNWTNFGPCSKSCGLGVQFRSRFCNNPKPAYGGNYCKGPPEEFQICGQEACPEPLQDSRAEQCARLPRVLNIDDLDKVNMTWLPYESDKKMSKCQLSCISKQTGEILMTGEHLTDGTKCSYDDDGDICVQGICHPVDCKGSFLKIAIEDSCGVCGGNNSQCVNLTSNFQRNIKREISRIGVIPRLTRNIKIECRLNTIRNHSENALFFMMRDRLRGIRYNLTMSDSKQSNIFIIKGAKFHYSKRGNFLKLWARGPILEEILISLYASPSTVNSGVGMAITTSYSIHKDTISPTSRFTWILGGWSPCTASCGGGTRIRTLACRDTTNRRIVTRRHCSLATRPAVVSEECNTFSCRFHWVPGPWEHCTKTCGSYGIQSREIYCVHHKVPVPNYGNHTEAYPELWQQAVQPDRCPDSPPEIQRSCNRIPCPANWEPLEWSQCSVTCGMGLQTRDFRCPPPEDEHVYTCGPKPVKQTKKCRASLTQRKNPICKNLKRKSCTQDKSEICPLTDYLGKYCIIPQFRRICCKTCYSLKRAQI